MVRTKIFVVSHVVFRHGKSELMKTHSTTDVYCGDSQKNKYKSRGYHFVKEQSFIYKCHNCGKTTSSVNFIKDHFPVQHKEYLKEWLQDQGKKPVQKMPPASKFKFTSREINHLNTKDDSLKAIAVPVSEKAIARKLSLREKDI